MSINLELLKKAGLFITGTDIGVGKTLIAGCIAKILSDKGLKVGVFKPIGTGCHRSWEGLVGYDAEFLADCANSNLPLSAINPVSYLTSAAPLVCAANEKRPVDFNAIKTAYHTVCENADIVIIEGINGVRTPLTIEFDLLDLAAEFNLPVVIVARPSPGTINHTLMTIDCLYAAQLKIAGAVINGYDATKATIAENTCHQIINQCTGVNILAIVPFDQTVDVQHQNSGELTLQPLLECDWEKLAQL